MTKIEFVLWILGVIPAYLLAYAAIKTLPKAISLWNRDKLSIDEAVILIGRHTGRPNPRLVYAFRRRWLDGERNSPASFVDFWNNHKLGLFYLEGNLVKDPDYSKIKKAIDRLYPET